MRLFFDMVWHLLLPILARLHLKSSSSLSFDTQKKNVSFASTNSQNICKCRITFNADILIRTGTVHTVLQLYFTRVLQFIPAALLKPHCLKCHIFGHSKHKIFRRFLVHKNLYIILQKYAQLSQTNLLRNNIIFL